MAVQNVFLQQQMGSEVSEGLGSEAAAEIVSWCVVRHSASSKRLFLDHGHICQHR